METIAERNARWNSIPLFHPYTSDDGRLMWFRRTTMSLDHADTIRQSIERRRAEYGFCSTEIRSLMEYAVAQGFTLIQSSSYEDGRPAEHCIVGVKPSPRGPTSARLTLSLVVDDSGPLSLEQATKKLEHLWRL